jgi:NTE family protein
MFRALASTPIVSSRYLRTDASPFGMSTIVREALRRFIPEDRVAGAGTELLVSTTRASRFVGAMLKRSARSARAMLSRRGPLPERAASGTFEVFASPSAVHRAARESDALIVHSNKTRADMHDVIVASCAIPGLYARLPVLDGEVHVDGGASDNTLLSVLVARGATEITVVSPYAEGAVSPTLFERERAPRVPASVKLRLIWPERAIRLRHFDFDPVRLEEALTTPYVERTLEPAPLEDDDVREGAA